MGIKNIDEILERQRRYFGSGVTLPMKFRVEMLKRLHSAIKSREDEISAAIKKDLGKSAFEGYMCETGLVLSEITYMIRHVRRFAAKKAVHTPLAQFAAVSFKKPVPYGNVLIMSPWNYPFLLTMQPLVDALAAGNTAVVKPSAYSPATGDIIKKIISELFPSEYVAVVTGGRQENEGLLKRRFDMIFFTGSKAVGKKALAAAAENITPTVLELGGKSPCIVDSTANINLAAKRIVFGKFLNCGQTCVAPDYIFCQKSVENELLAELMKQICLQFGEKPLDNADYGRIINEKHFDRICELIDKDKILCGGQVQRESLRIAPTVLYGVNWDDPVMQEEIFGPILPVLTFDRFEEVFSLVSKSEKPLALYIFSQNKKHIDRVVNEMQFGGGCVNDTVIHLATSEMGFGGVGESGMGSYHGRSGFEAFSHTKSIVDKKTWMDLPMRYQPYKGFYKKLIHIFLK